MGKPGILCTLEKGKAIGTQANFVDTFNWLVEFCNTMSGRSPVKVDGNVVSLDAEAAESFGGGGGEKHDEIEVITGVHYDPNTSRLYVTYRKVKAVLVDDADSETTVFTAVPYEEPN